MGWQDLPSMYLGFRSLILGTFLTTKLLITDTFSVILCKFIQKYSVHLDLLPGKHAWYSPKNGLFLNLIVH